MKWNVFKRVELFFYVKYLRVGSFSFSGVVGDPTQAGKTKHMSRIHMVGQKKWRKLIRDFGSLAGETEEAQPIYFPFTNFHNYFIDGFCNFLLRLVFGLGQVSFKCHFSMSNRRIKIVKRNVDFVLSEWFRNKLWIRAIDEKFFVVLLNIGKKSAWLFIDSLPFTLPRHSKRCRITFENYWFEWSW